MSTQVALARGSQRYDNIARVLERIASQIDLQERQQVLIKPNFVSTTHQLASTHVEAVRAVLDFVRARYRGRLLIAEGSALSHTQEGFERFGYRSLMERYDVELIDINADQTVAVEVYDRKLRRRPLRLARTVVESDFRISVGPPKTHNTVIVTLSLKNMIMGSLVNPTVATPGHKKKPIFSRFGQFIWRAADKVGMPVWHLPFRERLTDLLGEQSDKLAMHQGFPIMNLNLAILAPWVQPHLSVIDGFRAMEGAGPIEGDPVDWQIALAGTDALAVDSLTAHLMGFDPAEVGYLSYCQQMGLGIGELAKIEVLGDVTPQEVRRAFRPHPTTQQQRAWHLRDSDSRLRRAFELRAQPVGLL